MNVNPVQNNNSQSFGMALKLKSLGAKNLATTLEDISPDQASRFTKNVLDKIHASKTDVICDGENVIIRVNRRDILDDTLNPEEFAELFVDGKVPVAMPNNNKVLQYTAKDSQDDHIFKVSYDKPQNWIDVSEGTPLMQKLFNAKEILKTFEAKAAERAYKAELAAAREARIEERAKELYKLYS